MLTTAPATSAVRVPVIQRANDNSAAPAAVIVQRSTVTATGRDRDGAGPIPNPIRTGMSSMKYDAAVLILEI
jgi:hypothetical protein